MNQILQMAVLDLRLFFTDRGAVFWLFAAPLMFTFFTGLPTENNRNKPNFSPVPALHVTNLDSGDLGEVVAQSLLAEGGGFVAAKSKEWNHAYARMVIPESFTASLSSGRPQKLSLTLKPDLKPQWEILINGRFDRFLLNLNAAIAPFARGTLSPDSLDSSFKSRSISDSAMVNASFSEIHPIPSGFDHAFPGNAIMFLTMNLLIFSATGLSEERKNGILKRLGSFSISRWQLVSGKILGRFLIGTVFLIVFLIIGKFLFGVPLEKNLPGIAVVLLAFTLFAASCGIFLGSIFRDPEKAVGFCVIISIVLASLGGCWWPIEVVPDWMQTLAHYLPTGIAMESLHALISFGSPFSAAQPALIYLLTFSAAFAFLAFRNLQFTSHKS